MYKSKKQKKQIYMFIIFLSTEWYFKNMDRRKSMCSKMMLKGKIPMFTQYFFQRSRRHNPHHGLTTEEMNMEKESNPP